MVRPSNPSYHNDQLSLNRSRVALVVALYFGICSCGVSSARIPYGHSSLTASQATLISRGDDTGDVPSTVEPPKTTQEPQNYDGKRSSRVKNTSEFVNTSWWWSICVLALVAAICLIPFAWCYVLPKLGPVAWKLFIWVCTSVGFSAALAIIYLAVVATSDYLGAGVGGTLSSLSESLGEFSHHLPTPQGLAALTII